MNYLTDPAGKDFVATTHCKPYPAIDPATVKLPNPFVVCITGTSRGIGAHVAYAFARAGASGIAVCSPTSEEVAASDMKQTLHEINPDLQFANVVCDVTSDSSVEAFAAEVSSQFRRLDVLVCNAGFWGAWKTRLESTPEDFSHAFDVNCKGVYLASRHLMPLLLSSQAGARSIISICSADMHSRGTSSTAYCISKMAQARYIEYLAVHHPEIFTAAIEPGTVKTEMTTIGPKELSFMLIDDINLCGSFVVWLTKEKRQWLSGRYLSSKWDVDELCEKKDEIIKGDKLKMRMVQ